MYNQNDYTKVSYRGPLPPRRLTDHAQPTPTNPDLPTKPDQLWLFPTKSDQARLRPTKIEQDQRGPTNRIYTNTFLSVLSILSIFNCIVL